ncbi:D-alanyl-D-alanine carboxypeptidase [Gracilaria domingensis]|nr:D-alanyl-D-alanine carboxypeptidase [Gracilaria domingensis]
MGISFVPLDDSDRFRCSSPCVPFLQQSAMQSLEAATLEANDFITLNSAYRSSAQQYMLYQWFLNGQCDITAAARPGRSRHEDGLAIDVRSYSFWRSTLERFSWDWFGRSDRVHFTYVGSGSSAGVRRKSLEAFQRLWNRNNPADQIDEDGIYGPNTAARLSRAPCDGW